MRSELTNLNHCAVPFISLYIKPLYQLVLALLCIILPKHHFLYIFYTVYIAYQHTLFMYTLFNVCSIHAYKPYMFQRLSTLVLFYYPCSRGLSITLIILLECNMYIIYIIIVYIARCRSNVSCKCEVVLC